ncbi:DNRLRE domain-containing protein [Dactylosporangium aurantiacum]|uniref:DNRLRE domain-containing protein n=2 Tax=Dactylosporangium aurantiacum TaxID=35754 RepID=A0A9Q9IVH8_9ACTN|nr:DNRLRE domain-containing protein [Dactylosporangium aurantiacum]
MPLAALAVGAAAGTVALAGTAGAETTDIVRTGAGEDGYSSSSRPTYNFGASDTLVAGRAGGDTMVTYLKFTVASPGAGVTVKNARVTLTRESRTLPSALTLSKVASTTWTEKTLSAKNDPALGAAVSTVKPKSDAATVTFDVSAVVKSAGTYTFAVTSKVANTPARFRSSEAAAGRPSLNLTVVRPAATPPATKPPATTPSKPPATTPPTTPPTKPVEATPTTPANCVVDAKLVPSCGVLWGAAAGGFSDVPRDEALKTFEQKTGRTSTVYHTYHKGDELFPTKDEIAMTSDPANPRTLMLNWKVGYGTKWANVAKGDQDARIDRLSTFIKTNYGTRKFFMVLHHEPENDVVATAGSGMTAKDYAAMFRHTVLRMKANGVTNAVFVVAYMNYEKWNNSPWWGDLYPGDDVVDWVGVDTYNNAQPGGFHTGDFNYMMNRTTDKAKFPGWYTWATTNHPAKPIMVAEWGVYDSSPTVVGKNKADVYATVLPQLAKMPQIKGLVYFETAKDQNGHDIRMDDTPEALAGFRKIAADPRFNVKL